MRLLILINFILGVNFVNAQSLKPNESLIFYFITNNGKEVILAKDTLNNYMVYRFCKSGIVEMEYPGNKSTSWKSFKYSFYLRGGGIQNEGMDLNAILFENNGYQYKIYDEYYATDNEKKIGIQVTNTKTGKISNLKGKYSTRKGTLVEFRDNGLLEVVNSPDL